MTRKLDSTPPPAEPKPDAALLRELDIHREELATQNDDLRRANAALSAVTERHAQLYDTSPVAYLTLDRAGTIVEANLAAAELLDAPRNTLFGYKFDDLVAPSSRASFRELRARVLEHGARPVQDTVLMTETRRFAARVTAARFGGADTPSAQCLLCITDESERARLEEERRSLEARVAEAQRVESLGILAGGIAHDFNNILAIALASSELALLEGAESPPVVDALHQIKDALRRGADLAGQMLAYTGRGYRKSEPLDVSTVVRSMAGLLASSAPKGCLTFDLASDLPTVVGESAQIQQIVLNLVVNAAEAISPETGRIRIRTRSEPPSVVMEITDDGRGMDDATQRHAFDPFFSTKLAGRGLGLAVVHGNVQAHGGTVSVQSRLHGGTTFCVRLPATAAAPRTTTAANDVHADGPRGRRGLVLVVDDESELRHALERFLHRLGFDVCHARDGIEALEVSRAPPSPLVAVVLDLTMPRLGGEATLVELKAFAPAVPVIVTSGFSAAAANAVIRTHAAGFVAKPFTFETISKAMEHAVGECASG